MTFTHTSNNDTAHIGAVAMTSRQPDPSRAINQVPAPATAESAETWLARRGRRHTAHLVGLGYHIIMSDLQGGLSLRPRKVCLRRTP